MFQWSQNKALQDRRCANDRVRLQPLCSWILTVRVRGDTTAALLLLWSRYDLSRYLQTSTPCRPAGSPSESVWQRAWTALRSARPTASTDINVTDCTENNSWYKNKGKFPPKPTTHIVPLTSRVIDPSRLIWCEFQSPGDRKDQTSFSFGAQSVKKINVKT